MTRQDPSAFKIWVVDRLPEIPFLPSHRCVPLLLVAGPISKVREPRNVTIQPNLAAGLRACPLAKFPIVPPNLQHIRAKVVQKYLLGHDVMRHSFVSNMAASASRT